MGCMRKVEWKMAYASYRSILEDEVIKTIEWYRFNPSCVIFQQDSDCKHTTKLVKQWLSMQNFDVFTWPLQSHVQNLMEHAWALVKQKLSEYPTPIKRMLQLWEHVQASFHSITPQECQKSYHSAPNHIQVIFASKIGWTNY